MIDTHTSRADVLAAPALDLAGEQPEAGTGTPPAPLDPAAIVAGLGLHGATVSQVQTGTDNQAIFRVEHGAQAYALRVLNPHQLRSYHREMEAMRAASRAGIPVPEIHANIVWEDRPVLLLAWCSGLPFLRTLERRLWRIWPLGVAYGRMQAAIHRVAGPPELDADPRAWIELAGPGEPALQRRLRALAQPRAALLHLDYHPLNVMSDGTAITGVLDWNNTCVGDPRACMARTYQILHAGPFGPGRTPLYVRVFSLLLAEAWRRGYEQVAGPQRDMALFYAWAGAYMQQDMAQHVARPEFVDRAAPRRQYSALDRALEAQGRCCAGCVKYVAPPADLRPGRGVG